MQTSEARIKLVPLHVMAWNFIWQWISKKKSTLVKHYTTAYDHGIDQVIRNWLLIV